MSFSFLPCQLSCRRVFSLFPHLKHVSDPTTVAISPKRMISRTLAGFPWYSNIIYEEDFSEVVNQDQGLLISIFISLYMPLTFLCRPLSSPFRNINLFYSISSLDRNPLSNCNVTWAFHSTHRYLSHQQWLWPPEKHQMRMSSQSCVPSYALIVWWMYWLC